MTVEKTTKGAGVLVLNGGTNTPVVIDGMVTQDNQGSGENGTGAVEIRQSRHVTIRNNIFKNNRPAINLNGELTSTVASFVNISIVSNQFTNSVNETGPAICGSQFGTDPTTLKIGASNSFPKAATCSELAPTQKDSCTTGGDLGHDTPNKFTVTCAN